MYKAEDRLYGQYIHPHPFKDNIQREPQFLVKQSVDPNESNILEGIRPLL